nr:hypothetical protein GCM10020092_082630 [Actinoplanes digitatis]
MRGDQSRDPGSHAAPVTDHVLDEGPGDAVVDAVGVLTAAVAQAALGDAQQAGPGREIEEDDGVGALEPDRQRGGVVALDDPPVRGDEIALDAGELVHRDGVPALVVVPRVEVGDVQPELGAEPAGEHGLAGAAAADDDDPVHRPRR